MAVARREKTTDTKYKKVIGVRPPLTEDNNKQGREPEIEDVIEDLRDDLNAMCDLSALNENKTGISSSQVASIANNATEVSKIAPFTFTYRAGKRGAAGTLTIEHVSSRERFVIQA
jgi:hypothetical protein|tara:strand:- start:353 stop:700 length:348 start_codon:yes stop_codon:yes gene_type:complete